MRSVQVCFLVAAVLIWIGTGCHTPAPVSRTDPEMARLANFGRQAFERGAFRQAAMWYARALKMARAADDAREIGSLTYNLAACLLELDKTQEASSFLSEARAELQRAGQPLESVILMEAELARRNGEVETARALLDDLQRDLERRKSGFSDHGAMLHVVRANIACDAGDLARARSEVAAAKERVKTKRSIDLTARLYATESRIRRAEGDAAGSAALSDREADLWREQKQYHRMTRALARAADAYKAAGNMPAAFDRYYRAARSWAAQGDDVSALRAVQSALEVQEQVGDESAIKRLAELFNEIRRRSPHQSGGD